MIKELKGINMMDLRYPKAHGMPELRETICNYYKQHYGATITPDNVMVFAGGKPALFAIMLFLRRDLKIRIAQAEYPAYHAMMDRLGIKNEVVPSNEKNGFKPANADYIKEGRLALFSNPGNPTGQTKKGEELNDFVKRASKPGCGALIDEAYELMYDTPVSSLEYIKNIDKTNIFVTGACTKGL